MQDNGTIMVSIPAGHTLITNERYEELLDAETRIQTIDDVYRTNRGHISSDHLYALIGTGKPQYETEVKKSEEN